MAECDPAFAAARETGWLFGPCSDRRLYHEDRDIGLGPKSCRHMLHRWHPDWPHILQRMDRFSIRASGIFCLA